MSKTILVIEIDHKNDTSEAWSEPGWNGVELREYIETEGAHGIKVKAEYCVNS
jgi:hypothetical protein